GGCPGGRLARRTANAGMGGINQISDCHPERSTSASKASRGAQSKHPYFATNASSHRVPSALLSAGLDSETESRDPVPALRMFFIYSLPQWNRSERPRQVFPQQETPECQIDSPPPDRWPQTPYVTPDPSRFQRVSEKSREC